MKFLPLPKTKNKWKRRAIVFVACNLLSYLFMPTLFFGVWDTVGGVANSVAYQRKLYWIQRRYGRTARDISETVNVWSEVPDAINPMNWGR